MNQNANIIARHDYAPFGQKIPAGLGPRTSLWGGSDNVNQKFAGQERDGETNLCPKKRNPLKTPFLCRAPNLGPAMNLLAIL